ncbi:MAG: 16S rRNA (cytidine(1402)-2'-O)-methyltransferase [Alphaproteobacteria bacterium]|nr:16S rRNA (cytidine(1402)-2'-O)-methyltransferase [Alphaproteobacteria bacterium]
MACATPPEDSSTIPPPGLGPNDDDVRLGSSPEQAEPPHADADPSSARLFRVDPQLKAGLYIVSTPIGNLRDITLRALDVLASADAVWAEDTRVTAKLLAAYGVSARLRPYNDHSGAEARPVILADLEAGARVALVSDAGTPLVSDPGFKLVREAVARGINVVAIPGASAALTALAVAGLPTDRFLFAGFPPPKSSARQRFLSELKAVQGTLVFFEGPSRLAQSLADMVATLGPRDAVVGRELTKLFEELRRGSLSDLAAHYAQAGPPKGEIVVLVGPPQPSQPGDGAALDEAILAADRGRPLKEVAAEIAGRLGFKRREVYERALELRADETQDPDDV